MSDLRKIGSDVLTTEDFTSVMEFIDDHGNRELLRSALGILHWNREQLVKRMDEIADDVSLIEQASWMTQYATRLHNLAALVKCAGDRIVLVLQDPERRSAAGKDSSHGR
jgi:hypothetical protein